MEKIGAPSIYQLTKFIYLFNNSDDGYNSNSNANFSTDNSLSNVPNEQDVQGNR